jgi:hypothetical protein
MRAMSYINKRQEAMSVLLQNRAACMNLVVASRKLFVEAVTADNDRVKKLALGEMVFWEKIIKDLDGIEKDINSRSISADQPAIERMAEIASKMRSTHDVDYWKIVMEELFAFARRHMRDLQEIEAKTGTASKAEPEEEHTPALRSPGKLTQTPR